MSAAVVIPCRDEEATVGTVVEAAAKGLAPFGGRPIVVANACRDASAREARAAGAVVVELPTPGKGAALAAGLEAALDAGARAVATIDADLTHPQPFWIGALVGPVLEGRAAFAAPVYRRDARDATITNFFARPALAARRRLLLEQPIGGEFGLSAAFAEQALSMEPFPPGYGIDIALSALAAEEPSRIVQVRLGAKRHRKRDPSTLHLMFQEVATALASFPPLPGPLATPPVEGEAAGPDPEPVEARSAALLEQAGREAASVLAAGPPEWMRALLGRCAEGLEPRQWAQAAVQTLEEPGEVPLLWPLFLARVGDALRRLEEGAGIDALRQEALEAFLEAV